MGKLTISMAIFNSYVSHYQRVDHVRSLAKCPPGPQNFPFFATQETEMFSAHLQRPHQDGEGGRIAVE